MCSSQLLFLVVLGGWWACEWVRDGRLDGWTGYLLVVGEGVLALLTSKPDKSKYEKQPKPSRLYQVGPDYSLYSIHGISSDYS